MSATPPPRSKVAAPLDARKVVVLCAGLHGRVCIETLRLRGAHVLVGFLDDEPALAGSRVDDLPVLGGLARLAALVAREEVDAAVVGTANVRALDLRRRVYAQAVESGVVLPPVVHPTAWLSPSAAHGGALFMGPQTAVGKGCRLGANVCIYSGSTVDHDNVLGDHVFLGPGVHTAGVVTIGEGAYLGPGAVVGAGCSIGAGSIVGAGAVVVEDIPAGVLAFGVPARPREPVAEWLRTRV